MYTDPRTGIQTKVLAYFACGHLRNIPMTDFSPYDIVIFIDRYLGLADLNNLDNRAFFQSEKFILMETEAICAVDLLRCMDIKIDAFLCWNEGLFEGGGDYPLNGLFFQNFLSPILEDVYTHVNNDSYYKLRPKRGGIPVFDFIENGPGTHARKLRHIARCFERAGHRFANGITIRGMVRRHLHPLVTATTYPLIATIRANIWRDDSLDMILLPMESPWSDHMPMRRLTPEGIYHDQATTRNYLPPCNTSRILLRKFQDPIQSCIDHHQRKRFGIPEVSIAHHTLDLIRNAAPGSRIGMIPFSRPYLPQELDDLSRSAQISGSTVYLYYRRTN
jgi:hypothetical protein